MTRHYPGDTVGDFIAMRHKRKGQWLFRCVHCKAEKTASFVMMRKTGMQRCACQKPTLTPAQQKVAELAAQGLQNQAIAERLGLSSYTVRKHLSGVYARLNIYGRKELQGNA